jgi:hypothetical protein
LGAPEASALAVPDDRPQAHVERRIIAIAQ